MNNMLINGDIVGVPNSLVGKVLFRYRALLNICRGLRLLETTPVKFGAQL